MLSLSTDSLTGSTGAMFMKLCQDLSLQLLNKLLHLDLREKGKYFILPDNTSYIVNCTEKVVDVGQGRGAQG